MAKRTFQAGATSQTIDVFIQDTSQTNGTGLTGLAFNTSGLTAYYRAGGQGASTVIALATQTATGAWSSGGFCAVDATNMPGVYRLDIPNAILAASPYAIIYLQGAANMAPIVAEIEIFAYNPFAANLGLSNVPVNVAQWNGTNVAAPATAGIPDVNAKNINNAAAPTLTGDAFARLGAPAGASVSADIAAIKTDLDAGVNTTKLAGVAVALDANNFLKVDVEDWKGAAAPAMTGDSFARLGAPAGASVSADIAAIKSDTGTILTDVNTGAGAIYTRLGAPVGASISADIAGVPNALLDETNGIETSFTFRQSMRLMLSALCGKASGLATTTATFRDVNDTTNRIVATVDANGDRTAVTLTDT